MREVGIRAQGGNARFETLLYRGRGAVHIGGVVPKQSGVLDRIGVMSSVNYAILS
jgi:hypothetical protein